MPGSSFLDFVPECKEFRQNLLKNKKNSPPSIQMTQNVNYSMIFLGSPAWLRLTTRLVAFQCLKKGTSYWAEGIISVSSRVWHNSTAAILEPLAFVSCFLPQQKAYRNQAGEMFAVVHIFSLKWEQNNLKISFDPIKDI